ncbi:MAG: UDP-N-acetylenolpyruvoylglucosamine reductase [Gammaproteobacteria bacterium]|nr:MAG: UDP-N-acetylenolpyruvoylglucosamine reductase [Gammaproteobacteria bacterium]
MPSIEENVPLKSFNSLSVPATARFLARVESIADVRALLSDSDYLDLPKWVLGGGSNIVLLEDFPGLVLWNQIKGIEVLERADDVLITAGAGECWHDLVRFSVTSNWSGLENLSLIPGSVGAAPVQNIGAYGVELADVFEHLEAVDLKTGEARLFSAQQCQFSYRDSIFKQAGNQYCIVSVTLKLAKKYSPTLSYQGLNAAIEQKAWSNPTVEQISDLICEIRSAKLPSPALIPNVGSFFTNPVIAEHELQRIRVQHPKIIYFPHRTGFVKVAAGWLIEQCGWKGRRVGQVGCYSKQALVLVNYGVQSGQEIIQFAEQVQLDVKTVFGLELEIEPLLIDRFFES